MDPLTAVGLVSNIVQLVDAAGKAYKVFREIHKLGAATKDTDMTYTSEQLQEACSSLGDSLNSPNSNANSGPQVLPSHVNLSDLNSQCHETAKALHTELMSLQKNPDTGVRESLSKLILKMKKAKGIEQIKTRLDEHRKVLDTKVLIDIWHRVGQQITEQTVLAKGHQQQLEKLSETLSSWHSTTSNDLIAQIAKAIQASEEQNIRTRVHVSEARDHITSAIQNLGLSHDQKQTQREQEQRSQQQRKHFLKSLTFVETHLRMNTIAPSHHETFQWIFDDDSKRPWHSFTTWLKGDNSVYWIHGKPGSGKSTLMKFLAKNAQTGSCLKEWYPNAKVLIVEYYFWLLGNEIQRSFKGFLCSVIRQIVDSDKRLLDSVIDLDPEMLGKRNVNDWSESELQHLFDRLQDLMTHPVCLFIDGLDEFDHREDVDVLLNLIEDVPANRLLKVCASSRPENYISKRLSKYPQMRLQDLTKADMQILIRHELDHARSKCNPASIDKIHLEEIVQSIGFKADGVFLWVRYAIKSLINGMRNEDSFEDLLNRIEDLPSGMHQLYLQMWNRLNEDKQRYRHEAATYFSYRLLNQDYDFGSMSLFEMVIALDSSLQRMYIASVMLPGHIDVARQCNTLKTRLSTRCAGLLEEVMLDDRTDKYDPRDRQLEWEDGPRSPIQRMLNEGEIINHHKTKIVFMHRTARDFLLDTAEGRSLLGQAKESWHLQSHLIRARMAVMVQRLEPFSPRYVEKVMAFIAFHCKEDEVELLITLKRLCERLSIPRISSHNIAYQSFWVFQPFSGFDGLAARTGCTKYIRNLFQRPEHYLSPYYRGYLIASLMERLDAWGSGLDRRSDRLSMVSWLLSSGLDLRTKHVRGNEIVDVITVVLEGITSAVDILHHPRRYIKDGGQIAKQARIIIEQLLATLAGSDFECHAALTGSAEWLTLSSFLLKTKRKFLGICTSAMNLCWLAMQFLDRRFPPDNKESRSAPAVIKGIRVIFSYDKSDPDPEAIYCFDEQDSVLLGQKLEQIWFHDHDFPASWQDLPSDLEERLREIGERSPKVSYEAWAYDNSFKFKFKDLKYTLDPSEDVDESNWRQKGYFRKYDARDELHRSPEKLRMLERMGEAAPEDSNSDATSAYFSFGR